MITPTDTPASGPRSTAYFEGVADIEANTSKELTKLGAVIQVPFKAGNQFLGEGGMQVGAKGSVFVLQRR
jgi:hypothetical protein